jgi:hypothetical protein
MSVVIYVNLALATFCTLMIARSFIRRQRTPAWVLAAFFVCLAVGLGTSFASLDMVNHVR